MIMNERTTLTHEIILCKLWIENYTRKLQNIKRGISTYGYKHKVEHAYGYYIHESSFKQACIDLGFKVNKNNYINMNMI